MIVGIGCDVRPSVFFSRPILGVILLLAYNVIVFVGGLLSPWPYCDTVINFISVV